MTEAFLVDGVRTPIGRYGGALAAVRPDDLAAHVLRALTERLPSVDWSAVDDVVLGCANQAGEDNRNVARMALLLAGLPETVSGTTVNRLVRVRRRRGRDRCAGGAGRRGRPGRGRRGREHEPGTVRDGQGAVGVRPFGGGARQHAGLAVREPRDGAALRHRRDG